MTARTTFFLLGVCVGAAVPLIIKVVRPFGAYALAGGIIAYEAVCEAVESSGEALSASIRKACYGSNGRPD